MEFVLWIGITLFIGCMIFGVVYPAVCIFNDKIIKKDKRTVREIFEEL